MLLGRSITDSHKAAVVRLLSVVFAVQPLVASLHFHTVGHNLVDGQMVHEVEDSNLDLRPSVVRLRGEPTQAISPLQHCTCDHHGPDVCHASFWFLGHSKSVVTTWRPAIIAESGSAVFPAPSSPGGPVPTLWAIAPKGSPPHSW